MRAADRFPFSARTHAVDAKEASAQIREAVEEGRAEERASHAHVENFRQRVAVLVAVLAVMLATTEMRGAELAVEAVHINSKIIDTWAFYQAKNVRQHTSRLALDERQWQLAAQPGLSPDARALAETQLKTYQSDIAYFEDNPDPKHPDDPLFGEGKKQLMAQARHWEHELEDLQLRLPNYHYAGALLQIGMVLCSVAIIGGSRLLLGGAAISGVGAILMFLNGTYLFVPLGGVVH